MFITLTGVFFFFFSPFGVSSYLLFFSTFATSSGSNLNLYTFLVVHQAGKSSLLSRAMFCKKSKRGCKKNYIVAGHSLIKSEFQYGQQVLFNNMICRIHTTYLNLKRFDFWYAFVLNLFCDYTTNSGENKKKSSEELGVHTYYEQEVEKLAATSIFRNHEGVLRLMNIYLTLKR